MATTATANLASTRESNDPADVRAAAMAVLKLADERTDKGGTAAKHRSPLPGRVSLTTTTTTTANTTNASSTRSSKNNNNNNKRDSFNLFQWGKKQMDDMKESMNKLDEKFLTMQFEQEEKFRKAYDKTANDLSSIFSSPTKKNNKPESPTSNTSSSSSNNTTTTTTTSSSHNTARRRKNQEEATVNEVPTAISRLRTSFQGFTKKLSLSSPQHQKEEPPTQSKQQSVDEQIVAELEQLHELMTLCHSLLQEKETDLINQIDYEPDPRLPYTIKKLEAALPRMDQLMEAGIDGLLAEDTTQICVSTYERLILSLEKCNSPMVKSNAFAFTKDLEGDEEFDETGDGTTNTITNTSEDVVVPPDTPKSVDQEGLIVQDAAAAATTTTDTTITSPDLQLDALDVDLDIDLAAFEIGDDDDEDDILLGDDPIKEEEKKTETFESPSSDDDFIKDMFE